MVSTPIGKKATSVMGIVLIDASVTRGWVCMDAPVSSEHRLLKGCPNAYRISPFPFPLAAFFC